MSEQLISLAGTFGAPGLLVAFMVWDRTAQTRLSEKRIAADIRLAESMTTLAVKIDALSR